MRSSSPLTTLSLFSYHTPQLPDMSMYDDYSRVITPEMAQTDEMEEVCSMLMECMEMRKKWLFTPEEVGVTQQGRISCVMCAR